MAAQGISTIGLESRSEWEASVGYVTEGTIAVQCLVDLAAGRPALEFVVGTTGRPAFSWPERSLLVHTTPEFSTAIDGLEEVRSVKCGNVIADRLEEEFGLVFILGPGLFALPTQDDQLRCFRNAAEHLSDGGHFLVEVPSSLSAWIENGKCWTIEVSPDRVVFLVKRTDLVAQRIAQCYVEMRDGETPKVRSMIRRYASPAEMDLMAQMAGLQLVRRWGGWEGHEFTKASGTVISVYEKQ